MTWEVFYAICFIGGLMLSVLSFLSGALHLHTGHAHGHWGHARGGGRGHGGAGWPIFNFGTITAFLAWFGGAGYLLTRYSALWTLLALALSVVSGLAGAALVFWFMFKVLLQHERDLDPADYEMVGVLGRVSSTIREDGTGEISFSQEGVRRSASARTETGHPIPRGAEVIVTQYKGGIAYVRPFDEMSGISGAPAAERKDERAL
jgi:membrane protein implicated in regulation of membrane protease activity